MTNTFIVATDNMSWEDENEFVSFLKDKKCGWWHWIENFWIIESDNDSITPKVIIDKLQKINPNVKKIALKVKDPIPWAGYGPETNSAKMFDWLKKKSNNVKEF